MSIHSNETSRKGEDNSWLETYADTITLLMAFFVILLSMSTMDKKKYEIMREGITQGLNSGLMDRLSSSDNDSKPEVQFFTKPIVPDIPTTEYSENPHIEYVYSEGSGAEFIFSDKAIFAKSDYPSLRGDAKFLLKKIVPYLTNLDPDKHEIIVEGYIDDVSDVPEKMGKSRWLWSATRAVLVRNKLETLGVNPEMMHVAAYGASKPVEDDKGNNGLAIRENNEKNRRVVVSVQAIR
jgi:chemotaxis protein MotB